jgi:hypothetical protein
MKLYPLYSSLAMLVLGFVLAQPASAAPQHLRAAPPAARAPGTTFVPAPPERPVTPQFNDPGPQISVPQPGNAVEQLSPLFGAGQPDAMGIK